MKKVNTRDLFFYILERIVLVLIFGVLGAATLGVKYYLDYDKVGDISESSKEKIEKAYSARELYNEYVKSQESSGIMDYDYKDYYFSRVIYKLSGVSLGSNIYDMILEDINSDDFREKIAQKSETNIDAISLKFLASAWKEDIEDYSLFYYDLKTGSKEDGEKIIAIVDEEIAEVGNKYVIREKEAEWIKTDSWTRNFGTSEPYLTPCQNRFSDSFDFFKAEMLDAESTLSDEEKIYYKKNYLGEELSLDKKKLLKKSIIGFLIGSAAMVVILSFLYMFDGCVKSIEELKALFDLQILALVDKKEIASEKDFKHGFLRRFRYRFDSKKYIKEVLKLYAENVVLLYDDHNDTNIGLVKDIASDLPKFNYLHLDAKSQDSCKKFQSAVLVVQLGKIKYRELERELEVCSMCGIDINGVVAIV